MANNILCIDLTMDSENEDEIRELQFLREQPFPSPNASRVTEAENTEVIVGNQNLSSSSSSTPTPPPPPARAGASWMNDSCMNLEMFAGINNGAHTSSVNTHRPQGNMNRARDPPPPAAGRNSFHDIPTPELVAQQLFSLQPTVTLLPHEDEDINATFIKYSLQQMQELDFKMEELYARKPSWSPDDKMEYRKVRRRFRKLYQDHVNMVGLEGLDIPIPCVWEPLDLSQVTPYTELNEAVSIVVNAHIETARRNRILNVELPSFEEILGAIKQHPLWTYFFDEEQEHELAENIFRYITSVWKQRRSNSFLSTWGPESEDQDCSDPALSDPELQQKLEMNRATSERGITSEESIALDSVANF